MIGIELYKTYQAYNLHFNKKVDYDCIKYNFKTKVTDETFKKSKYRWQFAGCEKKLQGKPVRYVAFNVYEENDFSYLNQLKFIRGISKHIEDTPKIFLQNQFKNDLLYLKNVYNGSHELFGLGVLYPKIFHEYLDNNISVKTLLLLDVFIKEVINTKASRDIIAWPRYVEKFDDIKCFIKYFFDKRDVESIFIETYLESGRLD